MTDTEIKIPETKEERIKELKRLLFIKKTLAGYTHLYDRYNDCIVERKNKLKELEEQLKTVRVIQIKKKNKIKKEIKKEKKEIKRLEEESFLTNNTTIPLIDKEINEINEKINKFIDNFREGKKYAGELEGIDLTGMDLSSLNFNDLNLRNSSLAATFSCNLRLDHSDLSGSNLSMAIMRRPKLTESNLSKVVFNRNVEESKINIQIPNERRKNKGAYFGGKGTSFVGANLDHTDLDNVTFELVDADMLSVKGTTFHKSTNFPEQTILLGVNFNEANVEGAIFNSKVIIDENQKTILENKGANTKKATVLGVRRVKEALKDRLKRVEGLRNFPDFMKQNQNSLGI